MAKGLNYVIKYDHCASYNFIVFFVLSIESTFHLDNYV